MKQRESALLSGSGSRGAAAVVVAQVEERCRRQKVSREQTHTRMYSRGSTSIRLTYDDTTIRKSIYIDSNMRETEVDGGRQTHTHNGKDQDTIWRSLGVSLGRKPLGHARLFLLLILKTDVTRRIDVAILACRYRYFRTRRISRKSSQSTRLETHTRAPDPVFAHLKRNKKKEVWYTHGDSRKREHQRILHFR